jgi:hypothetical protein
MSDFWWEEVTGSQLAQGDLLDSCLLPIFSEPTRGEDGVFELEGEAIRARLIVMTQSCDLANEKASSVALCPIWTIADYESSFPESPKKKAWEEVRKGRKESLHLLASPITPEDNRTALVVVFEEIFSLPIGYLKGHADSLGSRWRLKSPYLEHLSQSFARFFMRVGLPSTIPPFK